MANVLFQDNYIAGNKLPTNVIRFISLFTEIKLLINVPSFWHWEFLKLFAFFIQIMNRPFAFKFISNGNPVESAALLKKIHNSYRKNGTYLAQTRVRCKIE